MGNLLRAVAVVSLVGGVASASRSAEPFSEVSMVQRGPNTLDVTVIGESLPPNDGIELTADGKAAKARLLAVTPYAQGSEPMAVVFVMAGQEIWTGNNELETDPNIIFPDTLGPIERAIEGLDLVHRLPKGSQAAIVTYANGVTIRMPMAPIEYLHGSSFGVQRDYYNQVGSELVSGVRVGLDQLERTPAHRKLLVVLGDGCDTNSESAAPQLAELKKRAAQQRIEVRAIVYKAALSCDQVDLSRMVPGAHVIASNEDFAGELGHIFEVSTQIFYATFDVRGLPVWDGHEHDLTLRLDWHDQDPVTMAFADRRSPTTAWWKSWWAQLLAGLTALGVMVLLARRAS